MGPLEVGTLGWVPWRRGPLDESLGGGAIWMAPFETLSGPLDGVPSETLRGPLTEGPLGDGALGEGPFGDGAPWMGPLETLRGPLDGSLGDFERAL